MAFCSFPVQVINAAMKQEKQECCKRVLYLNPPMNSQNNRLWVAVPRSRLVIEKAMIAMHVMVSASVSFQGNGRLHLVEQKEKVNADYYINQLLSNLVDDCHQLFGPTVYYPTRQSHITLMSLHQQPSVAKRTK